MNNTNLNAILVDDESRAIKNLSILINDFCPEIKIIGTADNVDDATVIINEKLPDVVFLDIKMPNKSGFLLIDVIPKEVQIVFVTAYDNYAIKAFEVSAVDYLLKPIEIERLKQTVQRLIENQKKSIQVKKKALSENLQNNILKQLVLPYRDMYFSIYVDKIIYIKAEGAYADIYYLNNHQIIKRTFSMTLKYFEKQLLQTGLFFRVHRSYLIARDRVIGVKKDKKTALLQGTIEIPISRTNAKAFFDWYQSYYKK